VTARRTAFRAAVGQADTRGSASLAGQLLSELSEETEEVFSRPEENLRLFEASVAGIGPKEVSEGFRRDWSGGGPLIALRAPKAPSAAEVRAAWGSALAAAVPGPPVDEVRKAWAYSSFGEPGRVVKRETVADPGFTRVTFENGVVMNFKRVAFTRDRVDVSVRLGAGRSGLPYENPMTAMLAAQLFTAGGLGQHDLGDLTWLFQDRRWSVGFTLDNNWYGLLGSTSPEDLELQMQIWAPS
jgi:zinc protease